MNTQNCPTPWNVRANGYQIEDANGGLIAQTHDDRDQPGLLPHPQAIEIARLIAAAPDLLDACQAMLPYFASSAAGSKEAIVKVLAAISIARATGNEIPTPAISANLNQPL